MVKLLFSFICTECGCITNCPCYLPVDDICPWCGKPGLVRQVREEDGSITVYNPKKHN